MSSAWSKPLRALATQTAVITIIGLGLAAPATAAQGDQTDNRNDKAAAAKAESSEKKSTKGSTQASSKGSAKQETRSSGSAKAETKSSTKASGSAKSDSTTRSDHSQGSAGTSGTPPEEQPLSKADQNTGGANGQCSDDDTADEEYFCGTERDKASGNGQGKGEATGKPMQAHKGKADNKNPPGQSENDNNNGYECDGNQGIAKGNPAHTACEDVPTDSEGEPKCPDGSAMPESGDVKDCNQGPKKCPDGSAMPPSGDIKDCEAPTPQGPETDIGGEVTVVTPPGSNRPPAVTPPVVAGVETLVPPAGVELTVRPQGEAPAAAPQALPGAAALPATGATPAMTALSVLAFGMLALGSGVLLYRRVTA